MQHFVFPQGVLPNNAATESTLISIKALFPGSLLAGVTFDYFSIEYYSAQEEIYSYYLNGPTGTLVRQILITYTDDTKTLLASAGIM